MRHRRVPGVARQRNKLTTLDVLTHGNLGAIAQQMIVLAGAAIVVQHVDVVCTAPATLLPAALAVLFDHFHHNAVARRVNRCASRHAEIDAVEFVARVTEAAAITLQYAITFAKARGKTSKKVFKISEKSYQPGSYTVSRKHAFADMSTRTHYPGEHTIAVVINGVEKAATTVKLTR